MLTRGLWGFLILTLVKTQTLTHLNPFSFGALRSGVTSELEDLLGQEFLALNASVFALNEAYQPCSERIQEQLVDQCVTCISDTCQKKINERCSGSGSPAAVPASGAPVDIDKTAVACKLSPIACTLTHIGKQAVDAVKDGLKKLGSGVKKFLGGLLPRIRLPRIRLPRIRLPRIRLPRIRLPRIRLPRIRLPRIRLPRIRLPRIRLPRIRLPRIRVPRIRLPRIRLRIFKRKRRQAVEPTCDQITANPEDACLYYKSSCTACSEFTVTNQTELIEDICGRELVPVFNDLSKQQERLTRLIPLLDIANPPVFNITAVQYDISTFNPQAAGFDKVYVDYTVFGKPYTLIPGEPIDPSNPISASYPLALKLFESFKATIF